MTPHSPTLKPTLRHNLTGVVLAGGQGSRMGGVDKGLQPFHGQSLAAHALQRLRPQVGALLISANRHLSDYCAMGVPVHADAPIGAEGFAGPLAGLLSGLQHAQTPWVLTVPCDTPYFPLDLAARMAQATLAQQADIALAAIRDSESPTRLHVQPVFCLAHTALQEPLARALAAGERKFRRWAAQHRCIEVLFDAPEAFFNANTLDELQQLPPPARPAQP